jgi:DNA-binding transcriptional regulator YiaG
MKPLPTVIKTTTGQEKEQNQKKRSTSVSTPKILDMVCNNWYKNDMSPKQIRGLRKDLELTQQELADLIGAQRVTVARWEIGTSRPTGAYLKLLVELKDKAKVKNSKRRLKWSISIDEWRGICTAASTRQCPAIGQLSITHDLCVASKKEASVPIRLGFGYG